MRSIALIHRLPPTGLSISSLPLGKSEPRHRGSASRPSTRHSKGTWGATFSFGAAAKKGESRGYKVVRIYEWVRVPSPVSNAPALRRTETARREFCREKPSLFQRPVGRVGWRNKSDRRDPSSKFKIGIITSLTGNVAAFGQAHKNGYSIALE